MTYLIQKDIPWKFDFFCCDAFNFFKKTFTSVSILIYWISNAQLIAETDASDYALAAILSIVNEKNEVHPVTFYSHTFTVAELNYDIHDKELLAIFETFKIWQHYLEGLAYSINCYRLKLKVLSSRTTLVLSNTRELDRVPSIK